MFFSLNLIKVFRNTLVLKNLNVKQLNLRMQKKFPGGLNLIISCLEDSYLK